MLIGIVGVAVLFFLLSALWDFTKKTEKEQQWQAVQMQDRKRKPSRETKETAVNNKGKATGNREDAQARMQSVGGALGSRGSALAFFYTAGAEPRVPRGLDLGGLFLGVP